MTGASAFERPSTREELPLTIFDSPNSRRTTGSPLPVLGAHRSNGGETQLAKRFSSRMTSDAPGCVPKKPGGRSSIRVVIRARPLHAAEAAEGIVPIVSVGTDAQTLCVSAEGQGGRVITKQYQFPTCIRADESQFSVFSQCGVTDLLDSALNG